MNINAYTVNAFAKTKEGGNPAGVVLHAESLTEASMRKIAAVLGFSETAFVLPSSVADFKLRFFTPNEEVDLCGHATIATFYTLASLNIIKQGKYTQETNAGVLGIEIGEDNFVMMDQAIPVFSEVVDKEEIADSLGISVSDISSDMLTQIVSTGLRDIMVPIKSMEIVHAMKPDMEKIKEVSKKYSAVGYHVFSLESANGANAYCRNFAPLYDIPEESATGTSTGALACYLYRYGRMNEEQAAQLIFEQGYSMNQPSELRVSLDVKDGEILGVQVGGGAVGLTTTVVQI